MFCLLASCPGAADRPFFVAFFFGLIARPWRTPCGKNGSRRQYLISRGDPFFPMTIERCGDPAMGSMRDCFQQLSLNIQSVLVAGPIWTLKLCFKS